MKTLKHIEIKDQSVFVDGQSTIAYPVEPDFTSFVRAIYKQKEISYPKFHKMSNMCKLGFLGTEFLLEGKDLSVIEKSRVAVVLACKSSSLQADVEYSKSMSDIPSPALFVYTLANIVTGEICIRHGFRGEELMLVQEEFDYDLLMNYVQILFGEDKTDLCITGFVDFDEESNYWTNLYLIEK